MYKLIFSESYEEKARRFLNKHPEVKKQYSVSINLSYRISNEFLIAETEVILVNVGNHQNIYGKK